MPDRRQLTQPRKSEGLQRLLKHRRRQIFPHTKSLPHRKLRRLRTTPPIRLRKHRAISHRPQPRHPLHLPRRLHSDLPLLHRHLPSRGQLRQQRMRRIPNRAHHCRRLQTLPIPQLHRPRRHRSHPRIQPHGHPHLLQLPLRVIPQRLIQRRQQHLPRMDQRHRRLIRLHKLIIRTHTPQQIRHLPRRLHPRIPASHHHKRQNPPPLRRITHQVRLLHPRDDRRPQLHRIPHIPHQICVLRHPRKSRQIHRRTRSQNQLIKSHRQCRHKRPPIQRQRLRLQIHIQHLRLQHIRARHQQPHRIHHMPRRKRSPHHLSQHRLKHHVVLLRNQPHL